MGGGGVREVVGVGRERNGGGRERESVGQPYVDTTTRTRGFWR